MTLAVKVALNPNTTNYNQIKNVKIGVNFHVIRTHNYYFAHFGGKSHFNEINLFATCKYSEFELRWNFVIS